MSPIERIVLQYQKKFVEAWNAYFGTWSVSTPLAWYPRLLHATLEQRNNFVISGAGFGIHWPDVDEDLSVHGMLAGVAGAEA